VLQDQRHSLRRLPFMGQVAEAGQDAEAGIAWAGRYQQVVQSPPAHWRMWAVLLTGAAFEQEKSDG